MTQLSERQQFGRALNAVRAHFVRKLVLPKIFFDVDWKGEKLDLLAVDRAGVGDVHALRFVRTRPRTNDVCLIDDAYTSVVITPCLQGLKKPSPAAQYRYVGVIDIVGGAAVTLMENPTYKTATFAEDGIGRVGILYLNVTDDEIAVKEIVKPERFRSTKDIYTLTDEYVATHDPVDEYRDPLEYQVSA